MIAFLKRATFLLHAKWHLPSFIDDFKLTSYFSRDDISLILPKIKKKVLHWNVSKKKGYQSTIILNWWKHFFFQISTGERTVDSPFSERPKSSHYWYPLSIHEEPQQRLHSPVVSTISNTNTNPASSGVEYRCQEQKFPVNSSSTNKSFHSSYARCLNMPPMMLDQTSWLENELLETRQVSESKTVNG